jgi:hypothetical protein
MFKDNINEDDFCVDDISVENENITKSQIFNIKSIPISENEFNLTNNLYDVWKNDYEPYSVNLLEIAPAEETGEIVKNSIESTVAESRPKRPRRQT